MRRNRIQMGDSNGTFLLFVMTMAMVTMTISAFHNAGTDLTIINNVIRESHPTHSRANQQVHSRRKWFTHVTQSLTVTTALILTPTPPSRAEDTLPPEPEERSGLVVLRVAEVASFQEKILRAVARGDLPDVVISPQQIVFGTQILLRNSNLAGNMKLMIDSEIPVERRRDAAGDAAAVMNGIQDILTLANEIQRPFSKKEMEEFADRYRFVRLKLNNMYEFLPQREKDKYYGYFMAVTEYEKKVAEGVYNPEVDGVLKFDYDN